MYSFTNDYSEGAHPRILKAMMETNLTQNTGYSQDIHTTHAIDLIRSEIKQPNADIHISMSMRPEPLRPLDTKSWPWKQKTAN